MKLIFTAFLVLISVSSAHAQTSKLILSSRWFHPINRLDTLSTLTVIKQLPIARIDWMYSENPKDLRQLRELKIPFSLTLHPQIADSLGLTSTKNRVLTAEGKLFVAPWMKNWKNPPYWGCVNNPIFKKMFYDRSIMSVNLGAYALFVDDALFNAQLQEESTNEVGCFCKYCIESYRLGLNNKDLLFLTRLTEANFKKTFLVAMHAKKKTKLQQQAIVTYQNSQFDSVVKFLKEWRASMKSKYSNLIFLANNVGGKWNEIYKIFDGGIAEIFRENLSRKFLDKIYSTSSLYKKTQVLSLATSDEGYQFWLIAYNLINKKDSLVPWDLYVPQTKNPNYRHFSNPTSLKKFIDFVNGFELVNDLELQENNFKIDYTDPSILVIKSKIKKDFYVILKLKSADIANNSDNKFYFNTQNMLSIPGYKGQSLMAFYVSNKW